MDAEAARRLFRMLGDDRFALVYAGGFEEGHTAQLIELGEAAAEAAGRPRAHRQRLAFIMVEAYQNITRHRAALTPGARECSFVLRAAADRDTITAINPISAGEADALEQAISRLRGATSDQLRAIFLARLSTGAATARGGAGLGLIEMARRSGQALRHRLRPLDEARRLFLLQATIGGQAPEDALAEAEALHALAIGMGLVLAIRCGQGASAQQAVVQMLERELGQGPVGRRAVQACLAAVSWLEQEGLLASALLCFGRSQGATVLRLVWQVPLERLGSQRALIARLASLTLFEVDRLYRQSITGQALPEAGLVELAHLQRQPLVLEEGDGMLSLAVRL